MSSDYYYTFYLVISFKKIDYVGHCSMIGAKTGKVVGYNVRSKFCKTCDKLAKKGRTPKKHDCRMNWCGSAKAMEQDMAVEMMKTCKEKRSRGEDNHCR